MRLFISWSGTLSHKVACVFHEWLPSVLQYVKPYISSKDIDKGARWSTDIAVELEQAAYGILIITQNNVNAPWVAFEAGALSKSLEKARVSPFLFDLKRSELQGPFIQFQSTIFEKEDIKKLIISINNCAEPEKRLEETRLENTFAVWWEKLNSKLTNILENNSASNNQQFPQDENSSERILEEILEIVRMQQRILNNPDILFPQDYFESLYIKINKISGMSSNKISYFYQSVIKMQEKIKKLKILLDNIKLDDFSTTREELINLDLIINELYNTSETIRDEMLYMGKYR